MKIKFLLLLLICTLGMFQTAQAQNWGQFQNVLSQMDSTQRNQFLNNLTQMQNAWTPDSLKLNGELDSLNKALLGSNPAANLDSLTSAFGIQRDSLAAYLPTSGLAYPDQDSLLREFDRLRDIWFAQNDSVTRSFALYQDSLKGQVPVFGTSFDTLHVQHDASLDSLRNNLNATLATTPANGIGHFNALFNQIFNKNLITSLELFGGRMAVNGSYYGSTFTDPANVIGVRSVEQFDRSWEPRWSLQISGTQKLLGTSPFGEQNNGKGNGLFNPLTIDGQFSIMYNLDITKIGEDVSVRLISLMGVEASTFCPSYRNFNLPYTNNNKGYTTGWGPQIGAGFSARIARFTAYTLGTVSYGDVNLGGPNYRYINTQVEAGIRFDNKVTMRVRTGTTNWAPENHKIFHGHQVTIGVPIGGLFKL